VQGYGAQLCYGPTFPSLCAPLSDHHKQFKGTRVQVTLNRSASQNPRSQPQPKVGSALPYSRSAWWSVSHCTSAPTAYTTTQKITKHTPTNSTGTAHTASHSITPPPPPKPLTPPTAPAPGRAPAAAPLPSQHPQHAPAPPAC
jgi:hypothetical protein